MATLSGIKSILDHSFLQRAGKLSFSLYLLNPPIIFGLFKSGCYSGIYRFCGSTDMGFVVCLIFSLLCIWVVAESTFYFIEQPGISIGEMVRLHYSNNPREKLKIRERLGAHKIIKRSKIAIILSVFLLMPWIFWEAGEIKLHQQQKITQKLTEVAATVPASSNELSLSNIPLAYNTAKTTSSGPWIESVSVNKKLITLDNTNKIVIKLHVGDIITLSGWSADIEHPIKDTVTYIVLESADKTKGFLFSTHPAFRKDVADFYNKKDLEQSGFDLEGKIPKQLQGNQWMVALLTQGKTDFIKVPTKYMLEVLPSH